MNWLQKIAQQWLETHPDYDIGNHLHAAFSVVLPETDGKSWEENSGIFYLNSKTYRYFGNNSTNMGLFFMSRNRLYRLDVLISDEQSPIDFMKVEGFKGSLMRLHDRDLGSSRSGLGQLETNNPKDFIDQVIMLIQSDFDNNDDEEEEDLFPKWPLPEGEYTDEPEEELSRLVAPRVRGYV